MPRIRSLWNWHSHVHFQVLLKYKILWQDDERSDDNNYEDTIMNVSVRGIIVWI